MHGELAKGRSEFSIASILNAPNQLAALGFGRSSRRSNNGLAEAGPPRFQAFKGEVARLVLNGPRSPQKPIPVSDLTLIVAAGRGINRDDKPFMRMPP
jgi:hypothetical protein